ncbi:hypothetical protein [uncultured Clostridium sp.]|uniref:hypothetical protein n=1 Tax=uncultured Clostridium sp. TaxID=59620 RepID=UPI00261A862D|nr:hypothetical protein [uncultured Clostridium sp.]
MNLIMTCIIFIVAMIVVTVGIITAVKNNRFTKLQSILLAIGGILNIIGLYVMKLKHTHNEAISHAFKHMHCNIGNAVIMLVFLEIILGIIYTIIKRKLGKVDKVVFTVLCIITILLYLVAMIMGIYIG